MSGKASPPDEMGAERSVASTDSDLEAVEAARRIIDRDPQYEDEWLHDSAVIVARALLSVREKTVLIEWRDAREVIFKAERPMPEAFTRLGAAELTLMTYARSLSRE